MARFTRRQRLTRPAEFRFVFAEPIRLGDRLVTVLARRNDPPGELPRDRLGLAVGRRKIPRAVARNTFKRVVRASFREHPGDLGGFDIVVLPKPAAGTAGRAALRASIDRQWAILRKRAGSRPTADHANTPESR